MKYRNNNVLRSFVALLGISVLVVWGNFFASNKPPQQWVSVEETQHPIARRQDVKGGADEFSSDSSFRTTRQIIVTTTTTVPDKKIIESSSAPSMNPLTFDKRKNASMIVLLIMTCFKLSPITR
jgi:hypothetical protein